MKMISGLLFALAASLILSAAALAMPFNDRSPHHKISPSSQSVSHDPKAITEAFNDQSINFRETAPAGSNKPKSEISPDLSGFNG